MEDSEDKAALIEEYQSNLRYSLHGRAVVKQVEDQLKDMSSCLKPVSCLWHPLVVVQYRPRSVEEVCLVVCIPLQKEALYLFPTGRGNLPIWQ